MVNSHAFPDFEAISDSEIVDAMLNERTKRDPCTGFSAFVGTTQRRKLQGNHSERLSDTGLVPDVYLAIRWWCLVFIPIIPLGAFAVADYNSIDRPFSDPHSRAFPVSMDWRIACTQAAVGLAAIGATLIVGLWVSSI